jgi:hypothetical protein
MDGEAHFPPCRIASSVQAHLRVCRVVKSGDHNPIAYRVLAHLPIYVRHVEVARLFLPCSHEEGGRRRGG